MDLSAMDKSVLDVGVVGLSMIVVYKILDVVGNIGKMWWMGRNGKSADGAVYMSKIQCMTDPSHFERIKQMAKQLDFVHTYSQANEPVLKMIREEVPKGGLSCTWKDRDEVLNMINAMKDNTKAVVALTYEIRKQNGG